MNALGQLSVTITDLQQVSIKFLLSSTSSFDWGLFFTILGGAAGFIAVIVAIVTFVISRRPIPKRISCKVLYEKVLVTISEEVAEDIQVIFDKKDSETVDVLVSNLQKVVLRLWNSGNADITRNKDDAPISIHFGRYSEVIHVTVKSNRIPSGVNGFNDEGVFLEPLLIKRGEALTIEVLLTNFNSYIDVVVPIADVAVRKIHNLKPVTPFNWRKFVAIFISLFAIALNAGLLIYSTNILNTLPPVTVLILEPNNTPPTIFDYKASINYYVDTIAQIRQSLNQITSIYEWFILIDLLTLIFVFVLVIIKRNPKKRPRLVVTRRF
jgi:hypothetical protein